MISSRNRYVKLSAMQRIPTAFIPGKVHGQPEFAPAQQQRAGAAQSKHLGVNPEC